MTEKDAILLLKELVVALKTSYISSWQTTSGWQKELDQADAYLEEIEAAKQGGQQ